MSTNAYITLTNIKNEKFETVTFYRHCDAFKGKLMADMFYEFFNNSKNAKGTIEKMICADPSQIEIDGFETISNRVCNAEYHYHFDFETMYLTVLHHEWWIESATVNEVFNGLIVDFINQYSNNVRSIMSISEYNKDINEVFTKDSMFRDMFKAVEVLKGTIKNPSNPNNKIYTKRLDRFDVFLSSMNLDPKEQEIRTTFQELNLAYQMQI
ncbi:hypothetical protein BCT75_04185 [Vibrio lentus]|uniref:hypothetical protein n=1 Tax=Vibrio lentus TaxID=136468 RepID=UPI000C84259E|nr:hypothetical protein [Vibrio lentus]PML45588.1 hypothetical protein BCT75_04185 [Vibrio lentus]